MTTGRLDLSAKLSQRSLRSDLACVASGDTLRAPMVVDLDPTTFCDLACPECISGKVLNNGRFSPARLETLASELIEAGVRAVILIGGGEPLIHSGTRRVLEVLGEGGVAVGVVTNGTRIDQHLDVLARYTRWVRVSVDAGTSETYQRFRPDRAGRSQFDRVIANMRLLAREKTGSLGYSYLVMSRPAVAGLPPETNVSEVLEAALLARDIGCDYFEVKAAFDQDHYVEAHPDDVMAELAAQLAQVDALISETFDVTYSSTLTALMSGTPTNQPKAYTRCLTAELRTLVTSKGVYVCAYHRGNDLMRIGDVVAEPFEAMWAAANRSVVDPSRDCSFHCARHGSNLILNSAADGSQLPPAVDDFDPFL